MNPGGGACSEQRLHHCTPAWATERDSANKQTKTKQNKQTKDKAGKEREKCHFREYGQGGPPDKTTRGPGPEGRENSEQTEWPGTGPMVVQGTVRKLLWLERSWSEES